MSTIERVAKAVWEDLDPLHVWEKTDEFVRARYRHQIKRTVQAMRANLDMNAIMRIAGNTELRPSEVDDAVTRYLDAVLQ